ncbi:MAG: hypothetical protein HY908_04705, partial [Myxococcales bacterium]|nr:hypothetical protein [Myxococcales bacterium]
MKRTRIWAWRVVVGCLLALGFSESCGDEGAAGRLVPAKITPIAVEAQGVAAEDPAPWALFDRDTSVGWQPELDASGRARVVVTFAHAVDLSHLKVFGPSPYVLSARTIEGDPVPGLERVALDALSPGWNLVPFGKLLPASALVLELEQLEHTNSAGDETAGSVAELELWAPAAVERPLDPALFGTSGSGPLGRHVDLVGAEPAELVLAAPSPSESGAETGAPSGDEGEACDSVRFALARGGASYRRAWLTYEIAGVVRPFALTRALNTGAVRRGTARVDLSAAAGATPRPVVEPLDPELLVRGQNVFHFCAPAGPAGSVAIRGARFIGELDTGSNVVEWLGLGPLDSVPDDDAMELLDPDNASARTVSGGERLVLVLDRFIAPDALLVDSASADWQIDCLDEAGAGAPVPTSVESTGRSGSYVFRLAGDESCAALALRPGGAGAAITHLSVLGSGARRRIDWPKIVLASEAKHFGRVAWIDGWASAPSELGGPVAIVVDRRDVGTTHGVFGELLTRSEDTSEGWPVKVTARLADGTRVTRSFVLERDAELSLAPPAGAGTLGAAESAERYGAPGQTATGTVDGGGGSVELGTHVGVDVPPGAVNGHVDLTVKHLLPSEVPPLDPGMINVTAPSANGYELLPHGQMFQEPVVITLPFDDALLPPGYLASEIASYYFDTEVSRWRRLATQSVDPQAGTVASLSDHFTVMINAVVVAPEHPELRQFDPNEMSGLRAADPGQGLALIEPPRPSARGDAELGYPFALPPGRRGLAPSLGLRYSSSAGNGWVGVGWDLPLRAITVDTRWGAARYDPAVESEDYLLEGAELTPGAHREPKSRTADTTILDGQPAKIFHARVEGAFRKIIRHGADPSSYWGEVIDKTGLRSFYGSTPEAGQPEVRATLQTAAGEVFVWALTEQRDLHGNAIVYHHERVSHVGFQGGTVPGFELYLAKVSYTHEEGSAAAPYEVDFLREAGRPDVLIDGRGGFKRVTAERLSRVEVRFDGELVRAWELGYREGAFHKSLLERIRVFGVGNVPFPENEHAFDYFDEVRLPSGEYAGFEPPAAWSAGDDAAAGLDVPSAAVNVLGDGQPSVLGGSSSTQIGVHTYVGFNPLSPTKQDSVGLKVGSSRSNGTAKTALVDLNGDGLPDKVFATPGGVAYRLNESGPFGLPRFSTTLRAPEGLPALGAHQSATLSVGAEAFPLTLSVLFNKGFTFTTEDQYFSDVNGDGLPDLVDGDTVRFNTSTENASGGQRFETTSAGTPLPIVLGVVDGSSLLPDYTALEQENKQKFPPVDTVRRWLPPVSGTVAITGAVRLAAANPRADGVRVAIQQGQTELWSAAIGPTDTTAKHPSGVGSVPVQALVPIYFRVSGLDDPHDDRVLWDPKIEYTGVPQVLDGNGVDERKFEASTDFVLAGRSGAFVGLPFAGTVRLKGTVDKAATSDAVTFVVRRNGVVVWSAQRAPTSTQAFAIDEAFAIQAKDRIALHFRTDSPIDLTALTFVAPLTLSYESASDGNGNALPVYDEHGKPFVELAAPFDMDVYSLRLPLAAVTPVTMTESGTLRVIARVTQGGMPTTEPVVFTVKRQPKELAAKYDFGTGSGAWIVDLPVTQNDVLYFDFSTRESNPAAVLPLATSVELTFDTSASTGTPFPRTLHFAAAPDRCTRPYRGWSYGGLHGGKVAPGTPIPDAFCTEPLTHFDATTGVATDDVTAQVQAAQLEDDTLTFMLLPFPAGRPCHPPGSACDLPTAPVWGAADEEVYIAAAEQRSSRHGADDLTAPTPAEIAHAHAVARLSQSEQIALGGGVGGLGMSGSASHSSGHGTGVVDYLDMNGDGFPDVVGAGGIQYTSARGTLEGGSSGPNAGIRSSSNKALNVGIGGNPAELVANAKGRGGPTGEGSGKSAESGSQMMSIGFTLNQNFAGNTADYDLMDVNGDGLPDRVSRAPAGIVVELSLGYEFAPAELFASGAAIHSGASEETSAGASLGMNDGIYGFGGGLSGNRSASRIRDYGAPFELAEPGETLLDLNGDGLLDRVRNGATELLVRFNTGAGLATSEVPWTGGLPGRDISESASLSVGGGIYFTIGVGPLCEVACYLIINPGGDFSASTQRQEAMIRDVDGDGYPDHLGSTNSSTLDVGRNRTGKTNLLRSVSRPMGATVELDYARSGNTVAAPQSRWVMSRVVVFDGLSGDWRPNRPGADYLVTTVSYEGGRYDRREREFYGYETVTVTEHDTRGLASAAAAAAVDAPYERTTLTFRNGDYFSRGLLVRQVTEGFDPITSQPLRYGELENEYRLREVATAEELTDPAAVRQTLSPVFPELGREIRRVFEGDASVSLATELLYAYDAVGNVTQVVDLGDVGSSDDYVATLSYTGSASGPHMGCAARHIIGLPDAIVVRNALSQELRRREASFDCSNGDLTELRQQIDPASVATSSFLYDAGGNLVTAIGPPNLHGARYARHFAYDAVTKTHVTVVTDSFGYASHATYDLRFGALATETDANGQAVARSYDAFGRLDAVVGPYEAGTGRVTLDFEYHPEAPVPVALTRHLDVYRDPADPIDTLLFVDGLGRVVQEKKDATVHTAPASAPADVMVVSGRVAFDHRGRAFEAFYPVTEPAGVPAVNFAFNPDYDAVGPTVTDYDTLGRPTRTALPDGTVTTAAYALALDRQGLKRLATTTTDALGRVAVTYRDLRELIRAVKELESTHNEIIWTEYEYDPLKELVAVRDAHGHITATTYDMLGRLVVLDSPDAGRTATEYDRAGNVIAKVTANLAAEHKAIAYDYDFNRLISISYPNYPDNDVTYSYGGPGLLGQPGHRVGRIVEVTDESGVDERAYGKLGELVRQTKTVASDTQGQSDDGPEVWTTTYVYDTWGRLQQLTYPDGEVLRYAYDSGGLVRAATGQKLGNEYPYVERLEHDKFGERAYLVAGNGVPTEFHYGAADRRLARLTAGDFQDLRYSYDDVGNIRTLENQVPVAPPHDFGGPVTQSFTYDDLNRLTSATGEWRYAPNKRSVYDLAVSYDTIHNIVSKRQRHDVVSPGGATVPQKRTSYDFAYTYGGPRPHAATQIGDRTYSYDASGNQRGWDALDSGQSRSINWDEEHRIQAIHDNGRTTSYKYDAAGERVLKRGEQGETAYVNQFWTVRNRTIATKHVFAGAMRVASKLIPGEEHIQ